MAFEIVPPKKSGDIGKIRISMDGRIAVVAKNTMIVIGHIDEVLLVLDNVDEWKSWTSVQSGQKVVFRTKLDRSFGDSGVISTLQIVATRETFVGLSTSGGTLVRVLP